MDTGLFIITANHQWLYTLSKKEMSTNFFLITGTTMTSDRYCEEMRAMMAQRAEK